MSFQCAGQLRLHHLGLLSGAIQRISKAELVSALPPALDQPLVAAGLKTRIGPLKLSTVVQRVAVLSTAHKLKRQANPCELSSVRKLLSRARRAAAKRGERPVKKTAITRPELEAMLATCDNSLEGLRDLALLRFGQAGVPAGAIFRLIWKGRVGPALLPGSVAAIAKRRAQLAGLHGDF